MAAVTCLASLLICAGYLVSFSKTQSTHGTANEISGRHNGDWHQNNAGSIVNNQIPTGKNNVSKVGYLPRWDSLDTRPLPGWYDDAKFGIFIHWGLFSVPAFGDEWFWYRWQTEQLESYVQYMSKNFKPGFKYADFAAKFTAQFFDPNDWADLFEAAGAKYVVLTSKHHEGFTNWPSKVSFGWNSVDAGPGRDLVGELAKAVRRKSDIRFGLYHSLYEWYNPLYITDKANDFQTQYYVASKAMPGMHEIVNTYRPDVLWSDGDWEAPDTYWNSTNFLAWLYNDSPIKDTVVTNDRWGKGIKCVHGDFLTCHDRYNPGRLVAHKWENCMTIDKESWGHRKNAPLLDYLPIERLVASLVETVSCGGNLLLNIGPTAEGLITPINEERLRQMGSWLKVNGEAIYGTKPWTHQSDPMSPTVWYTTKKNSIRPVVYALILTWPKGSLLHLSAPHTSPTTRVTMLGLQNPVRWTRTTQQMTIQLPLVAPSELPCQWAWVLKLEDLSH